MAHNNGGSALVADNRRQGDFFREAGKEAVGRHRNLRGAFALGFLFLSAVAGYGLVFVLIDKWYKGGTLGIL